MIRLKLINPVGNIIKDTELSEWTDIENFKAGCRFILESSDGSIYDYTQKEWMELPPDYQLHPTIKAPLNMNIKLEPVNEINTSDVLYDVKMKHFCIYPKIDEHNYDVEYIKKNCLKLSITSSN